MRNHTVEYGMCKFLICISIPLQLYLYPVSCLIHSTSNNGVPMKFVLGVIRGKWHHLIDHTNFYQSAIPNIVVCRTICETVDAAYLDLKI